MAATDAQKRYWKTDKGKAMKKAADARYYAKNAERIKGQVLEQYHELSPEEKTARTRRLIARQDPDVRRAKKREEQARVKLEVLIGYGGVCVCCDTDYVPHLTIDHVNGGGSAHRRAENQRSLYRRLRREGFPEGFQVMCLNCNFAKHVLGRCSCQDDKGG